MKKNIYRISVLALFICLTGAYANLETGLINGWFFDETSGSTLSDSVGNTDITMVGSGYSWVPGLVRNSFQMTSAGRSNSYSWAELEGQQQFTLSIWYKPDRATNDHWANIISRDNTPTSGERVFFLLGVETGDQYNVAPEGFLSWDFRVFGRTIAVPNSADTSLMLIDQEWNHIVLAYDYTKGAESAETLTLWLNGEKIDGKTGVTEGKYYDFNYPQAGYTYKFAQDRNTSTRQLGGVVDEICTWNRCLTDAEAARLYSNGQARTMSVYGGQPITPTPADLSEELDPTAITTLTWANDMTDVSSITSHDVYLYGVPTIQAILDGDPNVAGAVSPVNVTSASMPVALNTEVNYTYYWQVVTNYVDTSSNSRSIQSPLWSFATLGINDAPVVDLPNMIAASINMVPVGIIPTEVTDTDIVSATWEIVSQPSDEGIVATISSTSTDPSAPTAELVTNMTGNYVVKLTVTDSISQAVFDTMTVKVADDACAAAQLMSTWPGYNYFDINTDCLVNIDDFLLLAQSWLEDLKIAEQVEE